MLYFLAHPHLHTFIYHNNLMQAGAADRLLHGVRVGIVVGLGDALSVEFLSDKPYIPSAGY